MVDKDHPRSMCIQMHQAKMKEVRDLLQRGAFRITLKEELPDGANVLTTIFLLAIKSNANGAIKCKARYVISGNRDKIKHFMLHGAQKLQVSSSRLLVALASVHSFPVWTSDVKLAYLQSTKPLERSVFIRDPAPVIELDPSECFDLLLPLYGLCGAGDLWHESLNRHLTKDLHLQSPKVDPQLYFSFRNGKLVGIHGSYVDNLLRAGDKEFRQSSQLTHKRFETS